MAKKKMEKKAKKAVGPAEAPVDPVEDDGPFDPDSEEARGDEAADDAEGDVEPIDDADAPSGEPEDQDEAPDDASAGPDDKKPARRRKGEPADIESLTLSDIAKLAEATVVATCRESGMATDGVAPDEQRKQLAALKMGGLGRYIPGHTLCGKCKRLVRRTGPREIVGNHCRVQLRCGKCGYKFFRVEKVVE